MTAMDPQGIFETKIAFVERHLGDNGDFSIRRFQVFERHRAVLFLFSNMIDVEMLNTNVLRPLMKKRDAPPQEANAENSLESLLNETLYFVKTHVETDPDKWIVGLTSGQTLLVVEGMQDAILVGTTSISKRSIEQPLTEQVIRGPREGFIEKLDTNLSLIRYRLHTPDLRIKIMELGKRTRSAVAICHLEGIASAELVKEAYSRLANIDVEAILDSGYLEQYIEDNHYTPFPQVQYTERPDKVVANLLEGRVAILVDGSPLALIVPTVFGQFYQTVEDYTERFLLMSAIRFARLVALMFSLIFPSLYVSIISFNPELIPTEFAVAVAGGRAGVPFPAVVEVLIMEISMEVLREATIRLPQQVGGALSIVGVLVIGQAAVSAGFASPITVVIIALTTIGSFATPAYNAALALRLLRFPLVVMAGIFGLYGVMIGLILIANHMLSLRSFGVPYLSPLVPGNFQGLKDLLIRGPLWWMRKRPSFLRTDDKNRISSSMPMPPDRSATNVLGNPEYKENQEPSP